MSLPVVQYRPQVPKILGRGRPKGVGRNIALLKSLKPGEAICEVPKHVMESIRTTATREKIKIRVRLINPIRRTYSIWRAE